MVLVRMVACWAGSQVAPHSGGPGVRAGLHFLTHCSPSFLKWAFIFVGPNMTF